ncbi:hypothetical protein [Deinococcus arcticus]|uniref:hypothetical protein n=1 Tax=Deinococcus arcticus TaxID=2136176 RepID=UPI0011B22822|nr:hypothetical protein [Deinococcus arcticus]
MTLVCTACTATPAVVVNVTNRAASDITNVRMEAGGQVLQTAALQPGQTQSFTLKVQRDSDVVLTFMRGGQPHTVKANTYLTHGMRGQVDLTLTPAWSVTAESKLRTGWF